MPQIFVFWCVVFFRAWGLGASKSPAEAHYPEIPLNPNHLFRVQAPQGFMASKLMPFCLPSNHPASPDNECSQHTLMDSDNILYDPMYGNPIGPIVLYYTCGHAGVPPSKIPIHVRKAPFTNHVCVSRASHRSSKGGPCKVSSPPWRDFLGNSRAEVMTMKAADHIAKHLLFPQSKAGCWRAFVCLFPYIGDPNFNPTNTMILVIGTPQRSIPKLYLLGHLRRVEVYQVGFRRRKAQANKLQP